MQPKPLLSGTAMVAGFMLAFALVGRANLVTNGSFENPDIVSGTTLTIPGWDVVTSSQPPLIYETGAALGAHATEGTQAIDLGFSGFGHGNSISQSLATTAGTSYLLRFDWGSEYAWGTDSTVSILNTGGGTLASWSLFESPRVLAFDYTATPWIVNHFHETFVADGAVSLVFQQNQNNTPGYDAGGLALDNIYVGIPQTSGTVPDGGTTAALLGCAMAGFALARRGRNL